ncbi:MAG: 50S ribosomal protein L35 [Phycisphaerae bacterium]|nr:50S ribosomal protein L35 [Phycisphaerae bacterium]
MAAKLKAKTHKGLAKRVKITATGKVTRRRGGKSHLLSNKSSKRLRGLRQPMTVPDHMAKMIREQIAP